MFMGIGLDLKKHLQVKSVIGARDCKFVHENSDTCSEVIVPE